MPFVSDSALVDTLPAEAIATLLESPAPARARRCSSSSCARWAARCAASEPGHGAAAGIDAQFVLFAGGLAFDADMARDGARATRAA